MRVISKDYQKQLEKNEVFQFIVNHPKPDFATLEKESLEFENWISFEHKKENEKIKENQKK